MITVTSSQNQRVKRALALQQKAKVRNTEGLFVVEGLREVERAISCGYQAEEIWFSKDELALSPIVSSANHIIQCSAAVFDKICYRAAHAEVLAVFPKKETQLDDLNLPIEPLLVVIEGVEKPGNLGAIMRTCNGLGADALIVCDTAVDIFNPNVIRNSLGAFFQIPVVACSSAEAINFLKQSKIEIYTAYLGSSTDYAVVNYKKASALVFGSEANGLSDQWVLNTTGNILIPMVGVIDSLNVSVSVAVVLAEAQRQRRI
jgi:TrmH family RNA methyltransferase